MDKKEFSKTEALKFGWEGFRGHILFWVLALLVSFLVQSVQEVDLGEDSELLSLFVRLVGLALSSVISMGLVYASLKVVGGQQPELSDLLACLPYLFSYVIGTIIYVGIVVAGLFLLVVPGIIWAIKFYFYSFIIIDRNLGPLEALKESARITEGAKEDLFLLWLVALVVLLAGLLAFVVGLFIAVPVTLLATAYVYRILDEKSGGDQPRFAEV